MYYIIYSGPSLVRVPIQLGRCPLKGYHRNMEIKFPNFSLMYRPVQVIFPDIKTEQQRQNLQPPNMMLQIYNRGYIYMDLLKYDLQNI